MRRLEGTTAHLLLHVGGDEDLTLAPGSRAAGGEVGDLLQQQPAHHEEAVPRGGNAGNVGGPRPGRAFRTPPPMWLMSPIHSLLRKCLQISVTVVGGIREGFFKRKQTASWVRTRHDTLFLR